MTSSADSSLLMWALGALIVTMSAHLLLGWIRNAQETSGARRWLHVLLGASVFATAQSIAITLGLAGEALAFPIGYKLTFAIGLWLGGMVLTVPVAYLPAWRSGILVSIIAGLLFAALATAQQVGWVMAVGFRPGVNWRFEFIAIAFAVTAVGFGTALALGFPSLEKSRHYRYSWRIAAAGVVVLTFLAGFALVIVAAGLPTQVGSIYRRELPGTMLSLIGGGLLPLVLLMLVVDMELRRRQRRRSKRSRRRSSTASAVPVDYPAAEEPPTQPPPDVAPASDLGHGDATSGQAAAGVDSPVPPASRSASAALGTHDSTA